MNPDLQKQTDGRAATSPANGQKGGRPSIDWGAVAMEYESKTGNTVRWRKEGYYVYEPTVGAYKLLTEREIGAKVGAFIRGGTLAQLSYSLNGEKNVVGALRATADLAPTPPVWLSSGKSAAGWVAMRNCVLNVEAAARGEPGSIREHTPDFFSTVALRYDWRPDAQCPKFERFMEEVQPDEEGRAMCQMLAGLLLVPDLSYQTFFVLFGDGGCGKSTFLTILREMLGLENVCRVPLADFGDKFTVGLLTQKLANIVDDSPTTDGYRTSMTGIEGILKEVTGGRATMKLEPKGVDADTSRLVTARCVFAQNPPLPPFADRSEGLWRRLRVIPFPRSFYGAAGQNPRLAEEIVGEELEGVFRWAVEGLGRLRNYRQFPQSRAGATIVEEHRATCDREGTFLRDAYEVRNGAFTASGDLYTAYRTWCVSEGYQAKNAGNFRLEVQRVFPQVKAVNIRVAGVRQRGFLNLAKVVGNEVAGNETDI